VNARAKEYRRALGELWQKLRKKGGRAERASVCEGNEKHYRESGRESVKGMANHNGTQ
jgi:hypothetical protein